MIINEIHTYLPIASSYDEAISEDMAMEWHTFGVRIPLYPFSPSLLGRIINQRMNHPENDSSLSLKDRYLQENLPPVIQPLKYAQLQK